MALRLRMRLTNSTLTKKCFAHFLFFHSYFKEGNKIKFKISDVDLVHHREELDAIDDVPMMSAMMP